MIRENILKVKKLISSACSKTNQEPNSITVVVVSKGRPIEQIKEVIEAGVMDIGENRVQEALSKYNKLITHNSKLQTIKWHMVGHLQTNKAKEAVRIFDLIHSVDSLRLASEIDKQAAKINKAQDILVEVNTSGEATKFGLQPKEVMGVLKEAEKFKNISIKGLMTVAPMVDNPEKARPYFRQLRELRNEINALSTVDCRLSTLSMGMTDDYEVAIEEGANMVRLGRAIFEGEKNV
jgi:pyridoxal phosphate enzyme (YggS family)